MAQRRFGLRTLLAALLALSTSVIAWGASPATAETYTSQTLYFDVTVGPNNDVECQIVADLYLPDGASATDRRPAVLMTNGFGGSKDGQAAIAARLAEEGYVALTYSGLGFGGSSCLIYLDHPDYDGKAASQLISFLGGTPGIAYTDAEMTAAVPALNVVKLDAPNDPRIGMVGGSYGGQVQFAAAKVDDRLDTIVPIITWNDLSYSLDPNNTDQFSGVSTTTPGSAKLTWTLGFFSLGVTGDLQNRPDDLNAPCPNFPDWACPAIVAAGITGALLPDDVDRLREASVMSYVDEIDIPTLLVQGENDTLFNLNEGIATYNALKAQGTEVAMIWSQFGHSGPAAPGELDLGAPDPDAQYITGRVFDWFEHHLRDADVETGPEFAYFRDWIDYEGNAEPAYGTADSYPVGTCDNYYLGGGALVTDPADTGSSVANFAALPVGSTDPLDIIGFIDGVPQPLPEVDAPGSFAQYTTDPLTENVTVVGSPTAELKVDAPLITATQGTDLGKLVLYLKLRDVAPDGTKSLIRGLVAPVRIPDVNQPFTVTMPAIAHRFDAGHSIELTVASASINYRGNTVPTPISITSGPDQTLCLPLLAAAQLPEAPDTETPGTGVPGTEDPDPTDENPAPGPSSNSDDDQTPVAAASSSGGTPSGSWLPAAGAPEWRWVALLSAGLLIVGSTLWRLGAWGRPPVW